MSHRGLIMFLLRTLAQALQDTMMTCDMYSFDYLSLNKNDVHKGTVFIYTFADWNYRAKTYPYLGLVQGTNARETAPVENISDDSLNNVHLWAEPYGIYHSWF